MGVAPGAAGTAAGVLAAAGEWRVLLCWNGSDDDGLGTVAEPTLPASGSRPNGPLLLPLCKPVLWVGCGTTTPVRPGICCALRVS